VASEAESGARTAATPERMRPAPETRPESHPPGCDGGGSPAAEEAMCEEWKWEWWVAVERGEERF
jgi:hypothetical protein